jgi:hypothetical protein
VEKILREREVKKPEKAVPAMLADETISVSSKRKVIAER